MYIVIVCVNCNGSSQVEESMLGKVVECPLCGKPTVARTQTAVLPVAKPVEIPTSQNQEMPLSLDDATPLPPPEPPKPIFQPATVERRIPEPPPKRSPVRTALYASISLLLTLAVMAGVYMAFRYGDGQIPDSDWKTFRPPDGNCSILMPGHPEAEEIPAANFGELGGKRFTVKRWFERVEVTFGWMDYDAKVVDQRFGDVVLSLRDREIKRLKGKLLGESEVNFKAGDRKIAARLVNIDLEKGKAFLQFYVDADPERLRYEKRTEMAPMQFLAFAPVLNIWFPIDVRVPTPVRVIEPGQRIRIWFACAQGRKIKSDTAWLSKFFTSFAPE